MARVYLDHNASSPLRPEAREAMLAAFELTGNPSSVHAEGRAARAVLEDAREQAAAAMDVYRDNVIFTSGATEAANAAIHAGLHALGRSDGAAPVLAGATEHPCVLAALGGKGDIEILPVDGAGLVDADHLRRRLQMKGPAVVALQEANNETGVQQTAPPAAELYGEYGAILVSDMVQTAGRGQPACVHAHLSFISSHKFGGPKGAGALAWLGRETGEAPVAPLLRGGGQERGRRAGTENVGAAAGMAAALSAAEKTNKSFWDWAFKAQGNLEAGLREIAPDTMIFGETATRMPHTTCFAAPGVLAEVALMALDLEGIAVSSGSACSSGKVARSHVLSAMGVAPDLARCAIRVSTGWTTSDADIERFLEVWAKIHTRLRSRAAA